MIVKILLVDACTDGLFSGGRAAVAFLRHWGQEVFLQALADELGFPVTVYVLPDQDEFITRCFAPFAGEIKADSFAALAAAHAVYDVGLAPADRPVTFHGRGGSLTLFKSDPARPDGAVHLRLGEVRGTPAPEGLPDQVERVLGLPSGDFLKAEYLGADQLLIACRRLEAMESLNFRRVRELSSQGRLTLSAPLEAPGLNGYAIRCFSAEGALEAAPMSLTAHAVLGPFWAARLRVEHLEVHYISPRGARLWLNQETTGGWVAAGQVNTVFRADPVLRELIVEAAPDMLSGF